ncbi:MAG: helix-turn-helix transcriptional regulator [Clostridia bacterium]|nr:helix-turn-helix transcriptional regulator [Clostridia bacterium]MBQ7788418.1 helix-turn-helix transcriptional regulator [Clostridia bacterium]
MLTYEQHRSFFSYELYRQEDENLNFGLHLHNSFELLFVEKGKILVYVDGEEFSLGANEAILILPNRIHSYETKEYSKTYLCIFAKNYINTFYQKVKNKKADSPVFTIEDKTVINELNNPQDDIYLVKSALYKIAYLVNKATTFSERNSKNLDNYGKILGYISMHYQENITAKDIARELGYDHRYVTSLIKKGLKSTFRRLLNEYRISHAQYLLSTEVKNISQIAFECGYDSLCSFNRNFKEITGTTPKLFKKLI